MAVSVLVEKVSRELDQVDMTVSGSLNTTVLSTRLKVITPSLVEINIDLSPEVLSVPTSLPITRSITAAMLGLDTFEDGVYSYTYTVNYTDLSTEIAEASLLLFDSNTINAYMEVMERHIGLDCICSNEPSRIRRSEARELIEAANEFFSFSKFDKAKTTLNVALEFLTSCD